MAERPHINERTGQPAGCISKFIFDRLTPEEQKLYRRADTFSQRYERDPKMSGPLSEPPALFEPTAEERDKAVNDGMAPPKPSALSRVAD